MSSQLPIILITGHSAHAGLIEALRARGTHRIVVFGGPEFGRYLQEAQPAVMAEIARRESAWNAALAPLLNQPTFHVSGRDMSLPAMEVLRQQISRHLPDAMRVVEAFERLHCEGPVRAVVVHNEVAPVLRALIAAADRHGVPTLHLPHGLGLNRFALESFDDLIRCTLVGAQGAFTRDFFLGNPENDPERIALVGRPEWDSLYEQQPIDREEACQALRLDPSRQVVAFAGSWPHELTTYDLQASLRQRFRDFLQGIVRLGDRAPQVIVRPHPGHRDLGDFGPEWHARIAREVGAEIQVPDAPQETFLAAADLVVSLDSNFSAVALLAGRLPLSITWQQPGGSSRSSYDGMKGIATCAGDAESLHAALEACLLDDSYRTQLAAGRAETLERLTHGNDGKATERAIALIERMAERAPSLAPEGGYYGRVNRYLADMVPPRAKRILEVGCGSGYLGAWLKEQDPSREVVGFEAFPEAAREARSRLDAVIEGDVEAVDLPFPEGHFDCILYGDVLEHLRDPQAVLTKHRRHLAPNGEILVCVPNISHWSVIKELLSGNFTYADEGLLDRTHLRFFTPNSFHELLKQAGLRLVETATIDVPNPAASAALRQAAQALGIENPSLDIQSGAYQLLFKAAHAEAEPCAAFLPDRRGFNLLVAEQEQEQLSDLVEAYLKAFREEDDVVLHVLADASARTQEHLLAILERLDRDPEHIPDISLVDAPEAAALPQYLRAADLVLGSEKTARLARDLALPALADPQPEDLTAARASFEGRRWDLAPVPLDDTAQERWLVTEEDWAAALGAYLEAVKPGADTLLILGTRPGRAQSLKERVARWLGDHGHDPEAIPDVSIVETPPGSEVALFRSATAWVGVGTDRVLAKALGIPVLSPTPEALTAQLTRDDGKSCSIVVVTYNSMKTLEACVESVLATLAPGDELIVVDNASTDGTPAWLKDRAAGDPRMRTVLSQENLGFSAGTNAGLAVAGGQYLVLLNPDTVVTPGWLERMRSHFKDDGVGAVGPTSDYVAGLQKYQLYAPDVATGTLSPEGLAMRLAASGGPAVETRLLIGFCMMLPRRVLAQVGMLDETLFLGNDDLDLSWRLRLRGFRLLVATDAFVHHEGQVSFNTEPAERTKRLVQESTDALARKLVDHYGPGNVPASETLWGISWFTPSPGLLEGTSVATSHAYQASIVVLTYNQLEVTRLCLESLYQHTKDFELVVVDNNSTDGTVEFLRSFTEDHANVQLILNSANRGFAGGCNQGIAVAKGRDVVLLNNDTVVSEGWLEGMLEASRIEGVGLVGPRTNCIVGPQLVEEVPYDQQTLEGFESFARSWRQEHAGQVTAAHRVIGFCMLIRREVIDRIGALDTSFGKGNYEDDDYCMRAGLAGFQVGIVEWVFIHHFGSVTFRGQKIDYRDLIRENWARFRQKWLLPDSVEGVRGYLFADIQALPFDPQLHTEPVYSAEVPPAPLPDSRGFNIALADRDMPRLRTALLAYLQAFSEGDDVALHVLAGRDAERIHGEILDVIASHGLDPEHIPEISLLDAPDVPLDLPAYLASANLVVGSPNVALGARDMGLPAFVEPSAASLRLAFEGFAGLDWAAPPLPLGERTKERWLLAWSPSWERGLETFLGSVTLDQDITLLLRVKPGEAEVVFETLVRWLEGRGFDPEAIPDVVLVDRPTDSEVSVYRQATAWLDNGDPLGAAMARALGLKVIASLEDPALQDPSVAGRS